MPRDSDKKQVVTEVLRHIPSIISKGDAQVLVDNARKVGETMRRFRVTSTQVRNVFGPLRQIQLRWREDEGDEAEAAFRQVMLLRPKLFYQARRAGNPGFYDLEKVLGRAIEEIGAASSGKERRRRFQHLVDFAEAILAYHGGK